jgi:uncharacterized membrane protein required for colicin V production
MNITDTIIAVFWGICLVRGIFKGPLNELFSIGGVIGGLFVAANNTSEISRAMLGWVSSLQLRQLLCFLIFFSIVYISIDIFGLIMTYLFDIRRSGWVFRIFGAMFGLFKGVAFIGVILLPLVVFSPKNSTWIRNSTILSYESTFSERIANAVPESMSEVFDAHIVVYKAYWNRRI